MYLCVCVCVLYVCYFRYDFEFLLYELIEFPVFPHAYYTVYEINQLKKSICPKFSKGEKKIQNMLETTLIIFIIHLFSYIKKI